MVEGTDPTVYFSGELPSDPSLSFRTESELSLIGMPTPLFPPSALLETDEGRAGTPGRDVPAYLLRDQIGRGTHGEVWEAVQTSLNRVVAVKRPIGQPGHCESEPSADAVQAFRREVLTTAQLDHPNIIPVFDLGHGADKRPLMVMKLVGGTSWDKLIARDLAIDVDKFLARHLPILLSISHGVAFAHSRGIVHRDIKPAQIAVGEFGEAYLMDWGQAIAVPAANADSALQTRVFAMPRDKAPNPAGTPAYMAPEQTHITANETGPWTDVYLLGGILRELLTGEPPHPQLKGGDAFRHAASGVLPSPKEYAPDRNIPDELSALCVRAMARKPEDRMQSAGEFAAALESYLSGASRRAESMSICQKASVLLQSANDSYSQLEDAHKLLAQALEFWPDNPQALRQYELALAQYARAALRHGDRRLARVQAAGIATPELYSEVSQQIDAADSMAVALARQRRIALAGSLLLTLVAVVIGLLMIRARWHERERRVRHEREMQVLAERAKTEQMKLDLEHRRTDLETKLVRMRDRTSALVDHIQKRMDYPNLLHAKDDWSYVFLSNSPDIVRKLRDEITQVRQLRAELLAQNLALEPEPYEMLVADGILRLVENTPASLQLAYRAFEHAADAVPYQLGAHTGMACAAFRLDQISSASASIESVARNITTVQNLYYEDMLRMREELAARQARDVLLAPEDLVIEAWQGGRNNARFRRIRGQWLESATISCYKSTAPGLSPPEKCSSIRFHFFEPYRRAVPDAPAVARFTPSFSSTQKRYVYVTWPGEANAAPVYYRVKHADGETTFALAQNGYGLGSPPNANLWVSLGQFTFTAGPECCLEISVGHDVRPFTSQRFGQAVADAALFAVRPLQGQVIDGSRVSVVPAVPGPAVDEPFTPDMAIQWEEDTTAALARARAQNRTVLVFASYPASSYMTHLMNRCKDYCENRLFQSGSVARVVREKCVGLKIDLASNASDAALFGLSCDSTGIAVADSSGRTVKRMSKDELLISPLELAAMLGKAGR